MEDNQRIKSDEQARAKDASRVMILGRCGVVDYTQTQRIVSLIPAAN
jgi:hypothetical protein